MKSEFTLKLYDDEHVKRKLEVMSCLEAMFDDIRNPIPKSFAFFNDELPLGKSIKITFELVEDNE